MDIISDKVITARKKHRCDAFDYIMNCYEDGLFTYAELRHIVKMRRQKGFILPGQQYRRQVNTFDGFGVYKGEVELDKICKKYDLFDD